MFTSSDLISLYQDSGFSGRAMDHQSLELSMFLCSSRADMRERENMSPQGRSQSPMGS